jgi:hypothetical protein
MIGCPKRKSGQPFLMPGITCRCHYIGGAHGRAPRLAPKPRRAAKPRGVPRFAPRLAPKPLNPSHAGPRNSTTRALVYGAQAASRRDQATRLRHDDTIWAFFPKTRAIEEFVKKFGENDPRSCLFGISCLPAVDIKRGKSGTSCGRPLFYLAQINRPQDDRGVGTRRYWQSIA